MIVHPIPPVYDINSKILILGSFPSVKSREQRFFYGHPQNRFWKVTAAIFGEEVPETVDEKREFLLRNKIAVWDVIAQCEIEGSADSSIRNVLPNDISLILKESSVKKIFVNGKTAKNYYDKFILGKINVEAHVLPSTSPANAVWSLNKLIDAWQIIKI